MVVLQKHVLLLRAQKSKDEEDEYADVLTDKGFRVNTVNTLVFKFINSNILIEKLQNPDGYSGLIFTSPRCVEAVQRATYETDYLDFWMNKRNYTVGNATYSSAFNELGLECEGSNCGKAEALADFIGASAPFDKPFLVPHGSLKTDTFEYRMRDKGIHLDHVLVYETLPNPRITKDLLIATSERMFFPEFVVFFSPSGVQASLEFFRDSWEHVSQMKIIAIGPTTSAALLKVDVNPWGVCAKPTPKDLVHLICGESPEGLGT